MTERENENFQDMEEIDALNEGRNMTNFHALRGESKIIMPLRYQVNVVGNTPLTYQDIMNNLEAAE